MILTYTASRTIVFRFRGVGSQRAEVRIKIKVERARPLKATIGARWFRFVVPRDQVRFQLLRASKVPAGATVRVRCNGPGCPSGFDRRTKPRKARPSLSLLSGLGGVNLLPGASVNVTIAKPGYRGVGKLYCVRQGQRVQTLPYTLDGARPSC